MTKTHTLQSKYFGDRVFYKRVLSISVPIMVQSGITNLVSLLDNIMVGRIGTEPMSGVAIVNQLIFVYYLCIFGGFAGAGIFTAQYFGSGDQDGVRHTFRYKLWMGAILLGLTYVALIGFGRPLIGMYLNASESGGDLDAALGYGMEYLHIMLAGLPAFALVQIYANTLRECGETVVPMRAGLAAVAVNLVCNYLLIYGKFGFPPLGVRGAAVATVLSRCTELAVVMGWSHRHPDKCPYIRGVYRTLRVPSHLIRRFFLTGSPLLVNEALWSSGMAMLTQCYSMRGLQVVAAQNICNTVSNVFNVAFFSLGEAIAIIVGQHLGAERYKEARDDSRKIIVFSVIAAALVGVVIFATSPLFPRIYNTTDEAKRIATHLLMVQALCSPQIALLHASYFTLRSGGKTVITFLFDSVFMWVVSVPVAWCLSRFTSLSAVWLFALVQMADWIKCVIGTVLVKKGVWLQNIVRS